MIPLLYAATGIATTIPVLLTLGWAVWGAPISVTEYVSLLGSLTLLAAAGTRDKRRAARTAFAGAIAIWTFYLPAVVGMARVSLSDQDLSVVVLRRMESASKELEVKSGVERLTAGEVQMLRDAGLTGAVAAQFASHNGSGPKARAVLVMQEFVNSTVKLPQPDATTLLYVQEGETWKRFPADAPIIDRQIQISPIEGPLPQMMVGVETVVGGLSSGGLVWPDLEGATH